MAKLPETTVLLAEVGSGNERAVDRLLALVYHQLRERAHQLMARERSDHTLEPTALVHEVYLRLVGQSRVDWKGKTHFYRVASMAMDRLLKEYARNRRRQKRSGDLCRVTLDESARVGKSGDVELVDFMDAVEELRKYDERAASVFQMKVFFGLTHEEIAHPLKLDPETVARDWRFANAKFKVLLARG